MQKAVNDARTTGETLKMSPSNQFVPVELTYRDGSVSEIKSFRR
jgi:hypothetical protein